MKLSRTWRSVPRRTWLHGPMFLFVPAPVLRKHSPCAPQHMSMLELLAPRYLAGRLAPKWTLVVSADVKGESQRSSGMRRHSPCNPSRSLDVRKAVNDAVSGLVQ